MRKIAILVLVMMCVSSICFAQQAAAPAKESAVAQLKKITGKIVSVTVTEPAKDVMTGTVTIVDDMGKVANFSVNSTTNIIDAALNKLTLGQIKSASKVKLNYSKTASGENKAESITVQQ